MIYFDNAATSFPKPPETYEELSRVLSECVGNPGRGAHKPSLAAAETIYDCRTLIAELFGSGVPENVVFSLNATAALNLSIKGMAKKGAHILISDLEHNATFRPVFKLCKEGLCRYSVFSTKGDLLENIKAKRKRETAMVIATEVSNVTGRPLPIQEIGAFCQKEGLCFIIDGSQGAGHRLPLLEKTYYDAYCAPAHKGLFGIAGLGFAILRTPEKISTLIEGGSGVSSFSPFMPKESPERFEAGTPPTPAIGALLGGLRALRRIGFDAIAEKEARLRKRLCEGLSVIGGITVIEPQNDGGVVSFLHREKKVDLIASSLAKEGIAVRGGYHCAPLAHQAIGTERTGTVRASLGFFNTEREVDGFLKTLSGLIQ